MSEFDIITVGRVNLDLYAQETGVGFAEVAGWNAMIGGCPTNVALAGSRLGLRTMPFTAVGQDLVGDWVLAALQGEGIDTRLVSRKSEGHTSLALRAQLPPDHPLAFFRQNPADIYLTLSDADTVPLERTRALLVSADAFARGSMAHASRALVARARNIVPTYLDLDLRIVNWPNLEQYAVTVTEILDGVDVIIGTEEEFSALVRLSEGGDHSIPSIVERLSIRVDQTVIVKQ